MTGIDFTTEESDPKFMRLIDDLNYAAEYYSNDDAEIEALTAYGAFVEVINGTGYWRHPSRKAVQS